MCVGSDGKTYPDGASIPHPHDDCNACICIDGEAKECTRKGCRPRKDLKKPKKSKQKDCSKDECPDGMRCIPDWKVKADGSRGWMCA